MTDSGTGPETPRDGPQRKSEGPSRQRAPAAYRRPGFWVLIVVALVANWWVVGALDRREAAPRIAYSIFRVQADAGNVASVDATGSSVEGRFRRAVRVPVGSGERSTQAFRTERPTFADDDVLGVLLRHGAVVNAERVRTGNLLLTLLLGLGPALLVVAVLVLLARRGAGGGLGGFGAAGRSKARRYQPTEQGTRFRDVAGIDEAKEELAEVVDCLRRPERYRRLGGTMPRGVLLTGPPGTGKTLLARAVAGEAEVPFFSLSASEFVEMFVGVGASRVRDLFAEAKASAPAIVFIDELDAIGRTRGAGNPNGSNDEREQTLNQILTEMDGFTGSDEVIVLAATNRPEILDRALLRAGRFDRRIAVNPPDRLGRRQILEVHTRSVPLAADVDLDAVARSTPGMVGADLRTLVNEAALGAARGDLDVVTAQDLADALDRMLLGSARRIVLSDEDRRRTAVHESGHALLGMLEPGADPVRKVSIIPHGNALGVTFQSPEHDRYGFGESYLRGRITGLLGGRAAEALVYGELTTGAESDLEQATAIARQMVGRWGMSPAIGPISVLSGNQDDQLQRAAAAGGPRTLERVDAEVRRIVEACEADARRALREHRRQLEDLAAALLLHETLDESEARAAAGLDARPALPAPGASARRAGATEPPAPVP